VARDAPMKREYGIRDRPNIVMAFNN